MTREELQSVFEKNNVPTQYYSLRGPGGGDCYALELLDGVWTLSYYEQRGERRQVATFADEDAGCRAMFAAVAEMVESTHRRRIELGV